MIRYTLKPLTDAGWILAADGERVGLVSQVDGAINVIGKVASGRYTDLDALKKALGGRMAIEQPPEPPQEKEAGEVGGFPIKHGSWHNVILEPVPSYTRIASSDIRYAAGYYGLRFTNGWTHSFCPKLATLGEYEYIGPFTTKLEMQHQISTRNKANGRDI